ncbi:MAG TPA: SDR family oxidoreductase [Candidatus Limnocylindrales bacterium]|nr:SDR family oxidoreductase [Candidatus Limnocylindrales bacterium]
MPFTSTKKTRGVALITGASTGFGRLIAETMARNGYTVFATMRGLAGKNAQAAAELRDLASRESVDLHPLELDVTQEDSVNRAVAAAVEKAGRIDIVINNAGYGVMGVTEAVTLEQAQRIMDTNFFGVVRVNRAVLPWMRRQKSGLLMYISSGAGRLVIPGMAFYCASKFAMEALAEAYRYELAAQGIDSVVIQPGPFATAVFKNLERAADESRNATYGAVAGIADQVSDLLTRSWANPQELADAILKIIETPAGERRFRYRIGGSGLGVDEINSVCERVQQETLKAFGLTELTRFAPPQQSTSA